MNYLEKIKGLFNEAMQGIKINYAYLPLALRIIMLVILIPVVLSALALYGVFVVLNFFYRLFLQPCEYLEKWVDTKKENAHWLTEAVFTCITIPFIFFLRVLISFFTLIYQIIWFSLMIETYAATLGGVRWQPYIMEAEYQQEYTWELKNSDNFVKIYATIPIVFAFITIVFYIVVKACEAKWNSATGNYNILHWRQVVADVTVVHNIFAGITAFFVYIVNAIIFQKTNLRPFVEESIENIGVSEEI